MGSEPPKLEILWITKYFFNQYQLSVFLCLRFADKKKFHFFNICKKKLVLLKEGLNKKLMKFECQKLAPFKNGR